MKLMNTAIKVLVVDDFDLALVANLSAYGLETDYRPEITREEIDNCIHLYHILIVRSKIYIDSELLQKAKLLKLIARGGAGMDNIDESAAEQMGVKLINAPEGNRDAVGEHAIGMLLVLTNKLLTADRQVRNGVWNREANRGVEIKNKTIGIIGYGNTGRAVAQKLSGFEMKTIAYDKYKRNFTDSFVTECSLAELMQQADIVTLHVPLTKETKHMVNDNFIDSFSKPFYLLNLSRGKVVNLEAVLKGLTDGKIIGFAADVLENEDVENWTIDEKQVFNAIARHPSTIFTPHVAGWTKESYHKISMTLSLKIKALLDEMHFFNDKS